MIIIGKRAMIEEKEKLYWKQNCKCSLCGLDLDQNIQKNHLDHDHSLKGQNAGKVRGLLCVYCNVLEGEVLHKFSSSGLKSKGIDHIEWLKSLIDYYEQDLSENNIHPKYVPDKIKKFKSLNKPEMLIELESIGSIVPEKSTKADLIELYRKDFRKFIKVKYNANHS